VNEGADFADPSATTMNQQRLKGPAKRAKLGAGPADTQSTQWLEHAEQRPVKCSNAS
jgi:hypothetical protein